MPPAPLSQPFDPSHAGPDHASGGPRAPGLRLTADPDAPLQASHMGELRQAHRRSRPLRRTARVASVSAWSTLVLGAGAAPFALGDLQTMALSLAFIALGYNELCARRALQRFEFNAPTRLALNQLMLGGVLIGYALLSIADLGPLSLPEGSVDASLIQGGAIDEASIRSMTRALSAAVYVGLIIGTVLFQGSTAIYYITRKRSLRRFLDSTPAWVIDTMHALRAV